MRRGGDRSIRRRRQRSSNGSAGGSGSASEKSEGANEDDKAQEQAKVGAFEETGTQQVQQGEGEGVDLFATRQHNNRFVCAPVGRLSPSH